MIFWCFLCAHNDALVHVYYGNVQHKEFGKNVACNETCLRNVCLVVWIISFSETPFIIIFI